MRTKNNNKDDTILYSLTHLQLVTKLFHAHSFHLLLTLLHKHRAAVINQLREHHHSHDHIRTREKLTRHCRG